MNVQNHDSNWNIHKSQMVLILKSFKDEFLTRQSCICFFDRRHAKPESLELRSCRTASIDQFCELKPFRFLR